MTHPFTLPHKASFATRARVSTAEAKPRVKSSAEWVAYFKRNWATDPVIPWVRGREGVTKNLAVIRRSLRAWQLGETSDGLWLLSVAEEHGRAEDDPDFLELMSLFIREEQYHGELLGQWLDLAGIPRARRNWGDSCFRQMRHALRSIECWVTPVAMIEVLAMVYYGAVRRVTGSPVLREICKRLLTDEVPHIRFQCERLARILHERSLPMRALTLVLHRFLFAGIALAVWSGHRQMLRAGGLPFRKYWRTAWTRMRHAWVEMEPKRYDWSRAGRDT